jgi:hypothetical protein
MHAASAATTKRLDLGMWRAHHELMRMSLGLILATGLSPHIERHWRILWAYEHAKKELMLLTEAAMVAI